MESIEQPFDSITRMGTDVGDTNDKSGLIETNNRSKNFFNGDSPGAESSPLHHGKMTNSLLHGPQNRGLRIIIVSSIVFAVAVTVALILTIYLEPKQVHGHGAVSCEDVRCSQIGLDILQQGGNAVDATVAAAFCLGVVSPAHSGVGGGGLALVHDHKLEKSFGYNFRETVPAGGSRSSQMTAEIGIPGFVRGLAEMHKAHGKLLWRDLLQPAVDLAQFGFKLSHQLARTLSKVAPSVFDKPGLREMFLKDKNHFKDVNDTVTCPQLAQTLRAIQTNADSLYNNGLMETFLDDITSLGGSLTQQDLQTYTVQHVPVLISKFQDLTVIGLPPPASGATVALMLNMIDKLGWQHTQRNDNLTYHQLIEVYKFGLAQKSLLGDPGFAQDMQNVTANLTSPWFADQLVKEINDSMTFNDPDHYGPHYQPSNSLGMSQISVIDSAELMVSTSLGLNTPFDSKIWLPHTGIWLNSALSDFTSAPNEKKPGKRAMSSGSPTVVYNQEHPCAYRLIIGGSSGDRAITGIVESIVNSVIFRMNLVDAVSAPRVHNQLTPAQTLFEEGIPEPVLADLEMKGNILTKWEVSEDSSAVMAVLKTNDDIQAYSDYRMFSRAAQY